MNTNDMATATESQMGYSIIWDSKNGYFKILKKNSRGEWEFFRDCTSEKQAHEAIKEDME